MKILILYSTHEGQTEKIAHHIQSRLKPYFEIVCQNILVHSEVDIDAYDIILIATSIRYGFYHKKIKTFILNNKILLSRKITAFIGVNLVARKPNKNTPESNSYTRKFLEELEWKPTISAVFAGALYYPKYNFLDRTMIRFIMWMGKGETNTSIPIVEYTDWESVDQFSDNLKQLIIDHKD